MVKSLREKYTKALKFLGWIQIESASRRYWTFTNPQKGYKLFLGRSGSVRKGDVKTRSILVSKSFKNELLHAFLHSL